MKRYRSRVWASQGRWLPILGGSLFVVGMAIAGLLIAKFVIKPLAEASVAGPGVPIVPADAAQGQPTPAADAAPADAGPATPAVPAGWVRIKAGSFTMGSPEGEVGRETDEAQHQVKLTRDFLLMEAEVTQQQFEKVLGYNPAFFKNCGPSCPVEQVSWSEAAAYCNKMSENEVKVRCYECKGTGPAVSCSPTPDYPTPYECPGYRLPTESEWEYAARAEDKRSTYNGDLDASLLKCTMPNPILQPIGWFCGNSEVEYDGAFNCAQYGGPNRCGSQPVKQRRANGLELYDVLGNVWEWCHDRYGSYPTGEVVDPFGPSGSGDRVLRGGGWGDNAELLRASLRNWNPVGYRAKQVGFRVAVTAESAVP